MKERRSDLRVEKTYDALTEAFQQLLLEKSFAEITVRELCARARTRTATFYNHFSDKYDFFSFVIARMRRDFFRHAEIECPPDHPENFYIALLENGFGFMDANQKLVERIEGDSLLVMILNSISEPARGEIQAHLEADMARGMLARRDPVLLTEIFVGAMTQCSRWWFEHRRTVSRQQVTEELRAMIRDVYHSA